ncbi:MAG: LamG domain-containing protein, partial [Candidatus Omnitrophica bacterium]|nr:LamG domain-containing protein [Candidatus Omnitrophota bacterium]
MNLLNLKNWLTAGIMALIVLTGFVWTPSARAAAFNDAATGNWNIGTTWGGGCAAACTEGTDYPGPVDTATIDSHTVTLTAQHSVADITIASGGTLSAGSNRLIVTGGWNNTGGTFTASTSTVVFTSTGAENIDSDNDAFNDLVINDGLVLYFKFDETAANSCTGGTNDACDSSGFGKDGAWAATAASNTNIPTLNFINVRSIDLDGNSDYVSVSNPQLPTGDFTYAAWIDADTTSDGMIVMSPNSSGQNEFLFRVFGGKLNTFTNNASRLTSTASVTSGWTHVAVTRSGSTIRHYIDGVQDVSTASDGVAFNFNTCPVFIGTDVDSGCAGGLGNWFDGQIDDWRAYNRALSGAEIARLANGNVPGTASGTFTLQGSMDINGTLYINSGELDVNAVNDYPINLAGNWLNFGGKFAAQQGTVILDGTDQSLLSDETFYSLSKTVATARTLTFAAGSTMTINGTFTMEGASGQLLSLVSTSSGTRFELDIKAGEQIVNYVSVKDSEASTNNIVAINSTNAGGNDDGEGQPHWDFNLPAAIGGTVYTDEGTTHIGAGITVAISINGAAAAATDNTDSNGVYSFPSVTTIPGDIITLYIDGETQKAVTVMRAGVGAVTDVDLYQNHVIVRAESASALTNTNLATADNNGDADITGAYSISSGNLTVSSGYDLYVWPGDNTFTPGGTVTTPDLDIYGYLNMQNNAFTVSSTLINGNGGTLELYGGQTISTSTVNMNAGSTVIYRGDNDAGADTFSITGLTSTYYNLTVNAFDGDTDEFELGVTLTVNGTLNNPSGTWDFNTNDADITGNWIMGINSQNVAAGLAG